MSKTLQHFSDEYLEQCRSMTATQIATFLDSFRRLQAATPPRQPMERKLISMRVQVPLLEAFKQKAYSEGVPYQRKIQDLMRAWVTGKRR